MGHRNDVNAEPCGLCYHQFPKLLRFVPLRSVDVVAKCVHAVADVVVTQVFMNIESNPIEAVYYFPLDSNGAVVDFEAELNGTRIKGVAKAHEEAQQDYDRAIENYQTAFLGEETKADIFKVSIGYLKPGNEAKIVLRYVTEVKNERGTPTIRFVIPTTIAPRYTPAGSYGKSREVDDIQHSLAQSAPISILVYVGIQGEISSITSPSHQIKIESKGVSPNNENWTQAAVSLQSITTDMDRDYVLLVIPEEAHRPRIYLEERPNSIAFMTHMIPSFRLDGQKRELIFVLDRSGSMGGSKIMLAKKALKLFLHSLPADCYFNIISFGHSYECLFKRSAVFSSPIVFTEQSPESAKYTNETMRHALSYADHMCANMGGTEILQPLQKVYQSEKISGYLRQVFLLTDGEVSITDEIIGITKAHAHETRVFTLGIGNAVSHHLVEGIAAAGGGTSNFVTENEPIDRKVLEQLKDAIEPALTDVRITWEGLSLQEEEIKIDSPVVVNKEKTLMGYGKPLAGDTQGQVSAVKMYQQAPEKIPPLFDGSQSLIFGVFSDASLKPTAAIITAESPDGPLSIRIEVSDSNKVGPVDVIHKLATIKIVREIEMKSMALSFGQRDVFNRLSEHTDSAKLKKEIIDIAVREGIASKYTSFIAVDSTSNEVMESKSMLRRPVPSQRPHTNTTCKAMTSSFGSFGSVSSSQKPQFGSYTFGSFAAPMPTSQPQTLFAQSGFGSAQLFGSRSTTSSTGCFGAAPSTGCFGSVPTQLSRSTLSQPTSFTFASIPVKDGNIVNNNTFDNKQEADKLYQIISFQSFDGSFIWDSNLIQVLDLKFDAVKREATIYGWDLVAWSTVLVITFLLTKLLDRRDSWCLVSEKAVKWLNTNYGSVLNVMEKQAIQLFNS